MLGKNKGSKIKIFLTIIAALFMGLAIIYAANIAIPTFIIKIANLEQAKTSVTIVARAESKSEVPESISLAEIKKEPSNVLTKIATKLFAKTKRLLDLPYKERLLEDLLPVKNNKNPNEFSAEEIRLLARLVPLKGVIEKYAPLYGIDPIWYTRILIAESALDPTSFNKISKDYGLAQLKKERYALAKKELLNENSKYFSGRAFVDNIYNPETNLIFGLGLVRMNMDDNALKNTDYNVLSVMYNLGYSGIDNKGNFNSAAKTYLSYINGKKTITNEIIGAFSYTKTPEKITDPRVKTILAISSKGYSTEKVYNELLSFYLAEIEKPYKNDPWWLATALDEAGIYANIMQKIYGYNEKANFVEILKYTKEAQTDPKTEFGNYLMEIYTRNKGFAK